MTGEQEISEVSGDNARMAIYEHNKARLGLFLAVGLLLGLMGCQDSGKATSASSGRQIRAPQFQESAPAQMDMGEDWESVEGLIGGGSLKPRRQSASSGGNPSGFVSGIPQPPRYAICLASFTSGDHRRGPAVSQAHFDSGSGHDFRTVASHR